MHSPAAPANSPTDGDPGVRELCSGVDALYLSGRAELSDELFEVLEERRRSAEAAGEPQPLSLSGETFFVEPRAFGKYRYRLAHPSGLFGVTTSEKLPSFYVQPHAEFLHGVGPGGVLDFYGQVGEFLAGGPVHWSASRLDLFCDVQGWMPHGDERSRFVCRADDLDLRERRAAFGGLNFGQRSTNTIYARLYDKTRQIDKKGLDWWPAIWGNRYDSSEPVLRIEFQVGRQGLTEYGVDTPAEALELAGAMWANITEKWLTFRTPTADCTRARWPIAREWQAIQQAALRSDAIGVDRVRALRRKGELRKLIPTLVGYSARVGALVGTDDIDTTLAALGELFRGDEIRRCAPFADRIAQVAAEEARR